MTVAGGETRTPNIQIRSLSEWVNRERLQQTKIIKSASRLIFTIADSPQI